MESGRYAQETADDGWQHFATVTPSDTLFDPAYMKSIRDHQLLKCILCNKSCSTQGFNLLMALKCTANAKWEDGEFQHNKTKDVCRRAMHVGCAMWKVDSEAKQFSTRRRVFYFPSPAGANQLSRKPVTHIYCGAHARELVDAGVPGATVNPTLPSYISSTTTSVPASLTAITAIKLDQTPIPGSAINPERCVQAAPKKVMQPLISSSKTERRLPITSAVPAAPSNSIETCTQLDQSAESIPPTTIPAIPKKMNLPVDATDAPASEALHAHGYSELTDSTKATVVSQEGKTCGQRVTENNASLNLAKQGSVEKSIDKEFMHEKEATARPKDTAVNLNPSNIGLRTSSSDEPSSDEMDISDGDDEAVVEPVIKDTSEVDLPSKTNGAVDTVVVEMDEHDLPFVESDGIDVSDGDDVSVASQQRTAVTVHDVAAAEDTSA
jgi:hypothetical protein